MTRTGSVYDMKDAHSPVVSIRVPADLLDRIDADAKRRGKANRTAWFVDLATALLDGKISTTTAIPRPVGEAVSGEQVVGYSKSKQAHRKVVTR